MLKESIIKYLEKNKYIQDNTFHHSGVITYTKGNLKNAVKVSMWLDASGKEILCNIRNICLYHAKGNTMKIGKLPFSIFKKQLSEIEKLYEEAESKIPA